jgi:hypothetical protein
MTERLNQLREAIRRPLPLAYHPLYRFYEGGSLTRRFRGLPRRTHCPPACRSVSGPDANRSASSAASGRRPNRN